MPRLIWKHRHKEEYWSLELDGDRVTKPIGPFDEVGPAHLTRDAMQRSTEAAAREAPDVMERDARYLEENRDEFEVIDLPPLPLEE